MEKFNQVARRFSMRKDTTQNLGKYSKQPVYVFFGTLISQEGNILLS
jgi:hypothetical protein